MMTVFPFQSGKKTERDNPTIGVFTPGSDANCCQAYGILQDFRNTNFQFVFDRSIAKPTESLIERPVSWDSLQQEEIQMSPQEKADSFHRLVQNDDVDIIWGFDGPDGSIETIQHIDWDLVRENPKTVIGFSDISAFLNAITTKTGIPTIHAENLSSIEPEGENFNALKRLLRGKKISLTSEFSNKTYVSCISHMEISNGQIHEIAIPSDSTPPMESLSLGKAKGKLVGGNLTRLCELHDLGIVPDYKGAILFLEDTGETAQTINSHVNSLEHMGIFNNIAGLMIGDFDNIKQESPLHPVSLNGIFNRLADTMKQQNKPCIAGLPVGHVRLGFTQPRRLFPLPIGTESSLEVKKNSAVLQLAGLPAELRI